MLNNTIIKLVNLLMLSFLFSSYSYACKEPELFQFSGYTTRFDEKLKLQVHDYGESVTKSSEGITISFIFLNELENNPVGEQLQKNREELIYLISSGNDRATKLGMEVLYNLIMKPTKVKECGVTYTKYKPNELAFVLSRTGRFSYMLCELSLEKRLKIVKHYKNEPRLWATGYDAPWAQENMQCKVTK